MNKNKQFNLNEIVFYLKFNKNLFKFKIEKQTRYNFFISYILKYFLIKHS